MLIFVPEILPPWMVTLPEFRFVAVTVPRFAVPPPRSTSFEVSVENLPSAEPPVPIPTVVALIVPPPKVTSSDVRLAPSIEPPVIAAPFVVIIVNVPAADPLNPAPISVRLD